MKLLERALVAYLMALPLIATAAYGDTADSSAGLSGLQRVIYGVCIISLIAVLRRSKK